ncbi:MAG: hypothetical protein HFE85_02305 [Clostridiales bacterium]|nr:hypothetical protein [Clostridiales bacterium]
MKHSAKVALGGMIAALSVALMFLSSLFPFATYAIPAIAGMLLMVVCAQIGYRWAALIYAAVSVLSFLLVADREAALFYVLFFGYYPILKGLLEKQNWRVLEWILKFAVFNAGVIAAYFLSIYVLDIPDDTIELFGPAGPWILLGAGNLVFILYDIALTQMFSRYLYFLHPKLQKWFH